MTRNIGSRYKHKPDSFKIEKRAELMAELIYNDILKFNI